MTGTPLPALSLLGGKILTPDGLEQGDLHLSEGRILDCAPGRSLDLRGYMLLPGIIDLHGDGFERHVAPRRGAVTSLAPGLRALDAELGASGITTAVLAQFVSWEGGMRGPDFADRLFDALPGAGMVTDARVQLRLERSLASVFERVRHRVRKGDSAYVVVNDHLPRAALDKGKRPPRLAGQAAKAGRSPEDHHALMQTLHDARPEAEAELTRLCADLLAAGATLGSHDDETPEEWHASRALGCQIAEFPETRAAAEAARADGAAIVMGAPNVVRGGSHAGKVSAGELIEAGLVDALVSDYHYPAPAQAAVKLWRMGMALETAWGLVSSGPARVMGWMDRGQLQPGLRADLVVMNEMTLRIEGTFSGGRVAWLAGDLAARFLHT